MKKVILIFCAMLLTINLCIANEQLRVMALEDFSTKNPKESLNVIVMESATLQDYDIKVNSTMKCKIVSIVEPKRGKRNASFWVKPISFEHNQNITEISEDFYGKYSSFVLSPDAIKNIEPFEVAKKSALTAGNFVVKGFSIIYSFFDGLIKNDENNRIKSGVHSAYESTPLSLIEEGKDLEIKTGDDFYLVFKFGVEKN